MSRVLPIHDRVLGVSTESISDRGQLIERYAEFASDESNLPGEIPLELAFPKNWQEVSSFIGQCYEQSKKIVIAGAQTGVVGGALGDSDAAMISLQKLRYIEPQNNQDGRPRIRVGAGCSLAQLQEFLDQEMPKYWFPVDPTESSASFGGMAAVGAAGARSYKYGSIRQWINWIRVVLADGTHLEIPRGEYLIVDGKLQFQDSKCEKVLKLPVSLEQKNIKSTVGYPLNEQMDVIDLFIGSEGTLGVITDLEVMLETRPSEFLYILQFFDDDELAIQFISKIEKEDSLQPLAIESVDAAGLRLASKSFARAESRAIQSIKPAHGAAVYLEFSANSSEAIEASLMGYMECAASAGADIEDCIAGTEPKDLRDMKLFRHAIPERINALIRERRREIPEIHKLALDMSVPRDKRLEVYRLYKNTFSEAGLEFTIFGHAGDAHFHVNIISRSTEELNKAKELYAKLAIEVVALGGVVAAEHGLGRLKRHLLAVQYSEDVLNGFEQLRGFFDPTKLLGDQILCGRDGA